MDTTTGNPVVDKFLSAVQTQILNPLITLLFLGAFLIFVWGVIEYIRNAANDEKRKQGQQHMLWGIIGLVIMFGAVIIVRILNATALNLFQ